ncbi:MAG: cell division protein SepF [Candidatus Methanoplasma sp.]|nr:cell division protein SepF [Candidatus Methanoplasma sp.]
MFGRKTEERREKVFIDLNEYGEPICVPSEAGIKVMEITSHRDLKPVEDMARRGNILILDFSRFAEGDVAKKETAKRLSGVAKDINGAFAEPSDRLMILSPNGLKIDRCKIMHREG